MILVFGRYLEHPESDLDDLGTVAMWERELPPHDQFVGDPRYRIVRYFIWSHMGLVIDTIHKYSCTYLMLELLYI